MKKLNLTLFVVLAVVLAAFASTASAQEAPATQAEYELVTVTGPANYPIQPGDIMYNMNPKTYEEILQHVENAELNTPDRHFTTPYNTPGIWLYPERKDVVFVPEGYAITVRRPRALTTASTNNANQVMPMAFLPTAPAVTAEQLSKWGWSILAVLLVLAILGEIALRRLLSHLNRNQEANQSWLATRLEHMNTQRQQDMAAINQRLDQIPASISAAVTQINDTTLRVAGEQLTSLSFDRMIIEMRHSELRQTDRTPSVSQTRHTTDVVDFVQVHSTRTGETMGMMVQHGSSVIPQVDGASVNGSVVILNEQSLFRERGAMARREANYLTMGDRVGA